MDEWYIVEIRKKDGRAKDSEQYKDKLTAKERLDKNYPDGRWHTGRGEGADVALGIEPVKVTKYNKSKPGPKKGEGGFPTHKSKSLKMQKLREADPHTVWVRKDIWAAVEIFKNREDRSIRSVVEEALYRFLIQESRTEVDDMGESPEISSWVK